MMIYLDDESEINFEPRKICFLFFMDKIILFDVIIILISEYNVKSNVYLF